MVVLLGETRIDYHREENRVENLVCLFFFGSWGRGKNTLFDREGEISHRILCENFQYHRWRSQKFEHVGHRCDFLVETNVYLIFKNLTQLKFLLNYFFKILIGKSVFLTIIYFVKEATKKKYNFFFLVFSAIQIIFNIN